MTLGSSKHKKNNTLEKRKMEQIAILKRIHDMLGSIKHYNELLKNGQVHKTKVMDRHKAKDTFLYYSINKSKQLVYSDHLVLFFSIIILS